MKYAKFKQSYRFKDLKNNDEIKRKYADSLVYSRSYPHMFYCWFIHGKDVVFFKRPQYLDDFTLVQCVVIKTDSTKAARLIARDLTEKELKRMFNKCNFIIL